jgi:hypothetical protein
MNEQQIVEEHIKQNRQRVPVYIMHPFSTFGNLEDNMAIQRLICGSYNRDIYLPVSPILNFYGWLPTTEEEYFDAMSTCFSLLEKCDMVHCWGLWHRSKGCRAEKYLADERGIKVIDKMRTDRRQYENWRSELGI